MRACAVGALRNKTWAQNRVYDSDMTPLAEAVMGTAAKPYIVVYTDTDDIPIVGGKAEIYDGRFRRLQIAIEIGVASAIHDPSPDGPIKIQFSATDQGMEWAVDFIESQVMAALWGDPHSDWGDLFKRFAYKLHRVQRRRGGQAQTGIRFAARRVTMTCETLFDVAPGVRPPPQHPIYDFIELATISPAIGEVDVASLVKNFLEPVNAPEWRIAQAYLGLDSDGARDALVVTGSPLPWPLRETPLPDGTLPLGAEDVPLLEVLNLDDDEPDPGSVTPVNGGNGGSP